MTARRKSRATDGIAVAPIVISDVTAPALVGLDPRAFRALVAQLDVSHVRLGKRLLVRADELLAAIRFAEDSGELVRTGVGSG